MINESTIKKLNQMRLTAMAERYRLQQGDQSFESLSFDERLAYWLTLNGIEEKVTSLHD